MGGAGAAWATALALLFLFLTLLALALLPGVLDRGVADTRDQVTGVLEPARELVVGIELAQARQIALLQAFVLSGDARFRSRYRSAQSDEEESVDQLQRKLDSMSVEVRARVAPAFTRILTLSFSWHLGHEDLINLEVPASDSLPQAWGRDFTDRLITEQAIYQEVVSASRELKESLGSEIESAQARVARVRDLQTRLTRYLVAAGLIATLLVLGVAWRMRSLMRESETRRLETLAARREADALLRATGDGVLGMDREGRITFLNRAGAELLGYSKRMVVGRDVHELLHHSRPDGTPLPREECNVLRALERAEPFSSQDEVLWRAGKEPIPVRLSLRPLMDGRELKGAVLTLADMTEIREAEETLRRAVRVRDEVLAVVSHDLRNPVGTIVSAAGLLLEMELPPEKVEVHLRAMKRSGERMNRLIQDLLDVARMEAGTFTVHASRVPARPLLQEVVDAHAEAAEEKGVGLTWKVDDDTGTIRGDRDRLVQVLSNLVGNALKFTPTGGRVELDASRDPTTGAVVLRVSDTGVGISSEDRERLFDRFWQVSRRDSEGAGLGLSIVKGLVEAHGGRVEVESEPGKGSTFRVILPHPSPDGGELNPEQPSTP